MSAIQAEFIGYKNYEKKPYVRLIFEVPIEREEEVRKILGNNPLPGTSVWCGIARLQLPEANIEQQEIAEETE